MARLHSGNLTTQLPDNVNSEQPRNQDHVKRSNAAVTRGGGAGGVRAGGGRGGGGGRGEHVRRCYRCGDPGHIVRECPFPNPSIPNSAWRGNPVTFSDLIAGATLEFTSGTSKVGTNPVNSSSEVSTDLEFVKPSSHVLPLKSVDESPLLAKLQDKEKELQLRDQEIDSLKNKLNKATTELKACQIKNEGISQDIDKLKDELEKSRKEVSYLREKNEEMDETCWRLNHEFSEAKCELYEKIDELEIANEAAEFADSEMKKMKHETEQWRKAAKAIASVLVKGADICSKTPELESLVLYYSDRAAKRVSLGKIRKALDDCRAVTLLDPGFLKICLTAGNCHLVLGDIDDALGSYKKYLDSGMVCLDRRLTIEASDGLQKAEKVVSYMNNVTELLQDKTLESAATALEIIVEALSISRYSEKLLEMKGEALFMLQKYEDVIQMCEQTLASAEKNCATVDDSNHVSEKDQVIPLKLWRWNLMSKSYFHLAKFDLALATLEKYEQLALSETKTQGSSSFSSAAICQLLRCKDAGNVAFKGGKYREAVEHYSNAIMQSTESKAFTAICLCNRAAALQALGEVIDAIADCNLAIALDGDYLKAISRRAKLHEKIRDYEHAAIDFQRLVSLLEKKSEKKYMDELAVARRNLSSMNRNMKKGMTLDLYLILGLKGSESSSEIKKAYHKAALRHHPDKAGKFLARSERGSDGHDWKAIYATIHKDADKLFKIIGEAYAVLSDTNKRFNYNFQDAMHDDYGWSF